MAFASKSERNRGTGLIDDISSLREEFYSSRRKQIFFTSSQKKECADFITSKIPVHDLIKSTAYVVRDNIIYIDYSLFKQYASPPHYEFILNHIFDLIHSVIKTHGKFELHLYLATFSISAAERYKDFIQSFFRRYFQGEYDYGETMSGMYIYYVPSMMNTISTMLRSYMTDAMARRSKIRDKIFMYTKEESNPKLSQLFGNKSIDNDRSDNDSDA